MSAKVPSSRQRGASASKGGIRRGVAGKLQRGRILAATRQLVSESGGRNVTVGEVCLAARVSRESFYKEFKDLDGCMLALFESETERLAATMRAEYRAARCWVDAVRGALRDLLCSLDRDPGIARFLLVGSLSSDRAMRDARCEVLRSLADDLEAGRPISEDGSLPAPFGGEAVVGAVVAVMHARLLEDPVPRLSDLCGSLMAVIVLPYLGAAAARDELARE